MKRTFLAVALVAAGCGKKAEQATPQSVDEPRVLSRLPSIDVPSDQQEVIVRIDDHQMTRAQFEQQVAFRLGERAQQLSPNLLGIARQQIGRKILEQYIAQTLLFDAATATGIQISDEDRQRALDKLDKQLQSQGKTLEETMQSNKLGQAHMKEEVLRGLHINKYLAQQLPKPSEPTAAEIDAALAQIPETVHARHILIKVVAGSDEQTRIGRRAKADALRVQLVDGGDFAGLARTQSDGPSAPRGGDLGRFHRGKMVAEFETAAFNQKVGEIGPVIETKFGYHIIQVIDHVDAADAPREAIVAQLRAQKRSQSVIDMVRELMRTARVDYASSISGLIPPAMRIDE